jgi:4-hydroxy-3-methylbut-2-enyl diphosphate reductase
MVKGAKAVGITAGASAPERLVEEVVATLRALGAAEVSALPGITEDVTFRLPARLQPAG